MVINVIKGVDEIKFDIYKLQEHVMILIDEYMDKYGERPGYIKMPQWAVMALEECFRAQVTSHIPCAEVLFEKKTFLGLEVCATKAIDTINEIEVF